MSEKYPLQETLSPIDKKGRDRLNENWARIMAYFDHVQLQIKALAGGHEVDELIARLEQAIANAESDLQNYIAQVDTTVQEAIDANNTATQNAIDTNNTALQIALGKIADKLTELNTAISNAETATSDANAAKNAAIQATQDAQNAINTMKSLIDNFGSKGTWSATTQYYKNNLAEVDGRTYIALKDNINTPVTDKSTWVLFADKGATGATGPQGLPGKDGKDGTGVTIIGSLPSEDDLPSTGNLGDAYLINGFLYVWNGTVWENVGEIQGPEGKSAYDLAVQNGFVGTMEEWLESLKGKTGPPGPEGPQGPPGKDADLTEVTEQLAEMKPKVDNSWQKGVYNDIDITNLGEFNVKRSFMIKPNDWVAPDSNIERLSIVIPTVHFSGIVKVTYTCSWVQSNAEGGAEVVHNYAKTTDVLRTYSKTITSISNLFANHYFIVDCQHNNDVFTIPIVRTPQGKNYVTITVELYATQPMSMDMLKNATLLFEDLGTSWSGYPWTPQRASFVKASGDTMTGDLTLNKGIPRIVLKPTLATPDATKHFDMFYNAAGGNNFGVAFNLDEKSVIQILDSKNVRFVGHDDAWFSIQDLKSSASDVKTNVAAAITEQGVPTSPTATGAEMAANIRAIPKGRKEASGIAYASNVSGRARLVVTGLSFNPIAIFITKENNSNTEFKAVWAPSNVFFGNNTNAYMNFFTYNETGNIMIASPSLDSNYQGFEMTVSMTYNSRSEGAYRWFAFG